MKIVEEIRQDEHLRKGIRLDNRLLFDFFYLEESKYLKLCGKAEKREKGSILGEGDLFIVTSGSGRNSGELGSGTSE